MRNNWVLKVHGVEERPDCRPLLSREGRTSDGTTHITSKIPSSPPHHCRPPEGLLWQNKKGQYRSMPDSRRREREVTHSSESLSARHGGDGSGGTHLFSSLFLFPSAAHREPPGHRVRSHFISPFCMPFIYLPRVCWFVCLTQ